MRSRLKVAEIKQWRAKLLQEQGGLCSLCKLPIESGKETLDHCHDSGRIRTVLHRQCNQVEGRIKSWVNRAGKHIDPVQFLEALIDHWEQSYDHLPYHPQHRSEIEKQITVLKRKRKRLKTRKGKLRYTNKIKHLERNNG